MAITGGVIPFLIELGILLLVILYVLTPKFGTLLAHVYKFDFELSGSLADGGITLESQKVIARFLPVTATFSVFPDELRDCS